MEWNKRIALYCSDVAGAFDRVDSNKMYQKLQTTGIHHKIACLLRSWLERRIAYVVVHGAKSNPLVLENMIFQGTVLGPILCNIFYADCKRPVRAKTFTETVFADDLNCFKGYPKAIGRRAEA